MARTISRERKIGVMVQTAEGTPADTITSSDLVQATELTLNANQQQLARADFGFGRDEAGFVQGGTIEADGTLSGHLVLPGTLGSPQHENIFLSAMAVAAKVSVATTVAAGSPTVSTYDLTSATGVQNGDILFVDIGSGVFEGRPGTISGVAWTVDIDHSAAPIVAAAVQAETYRLGTADQFLTVFDFLTNHKRQLEDVLINELSFSFEDIVNWTANLIGSNLIETVETEPAVPTFAGDAFARNFGDVWMDKTTAISSAFKKIDALSMAIRILNNVERNPAAIGSTKADGVTPGTRQVRLDVSIPVGTVTGENSVYFDDALAKTAQRFFFQGATSAAFATGNNFAIHMPKVELARPAGDIDTSNPLSVYNFNDSIAFATTTNDSIVLAFG